MPVPRPKPLTDTPCPRCEGLVETGAMSKYWIQRLPQGAFAPLAVDGSGKCCTLCGLADTMAKFTAGVDFGMARIAVGQDWAEQLRLPGVRIGATKLVPPAEPGDLDAHAEWLTRMGYRTTYDWLYS